MEGSRLALNSPVGYTLSFEVIRKGLFRASSRYELPFMVASGGEVGKQYPRIAIVGHT